ncbi:cation diffusion facilitator family transporter [Bacteroidota bacterium]
MDKKAKVARLSIISNSFLIILKFIAGIMSGSVSIISEAIHSFMDLIASVIAFIAVRISGKSPDEQHPYGHGKVENVSGVTEAFLIFIAAAWIIYEAINKFFNNEHIENIGIGASVMLISGIINFIVSRRLYKVAKETDSVALEADALHLKTDVYTSIGVGIGLILIKITGFHLLDPIIAIIVALIILRESYKLLRKAFNPLLDSSISEDEIEMIISELNKLKVKYHHLRTRKAGPYKFADMHIEMPESLTLKEVHQKCDHIESQLKKTISDLDVNIHVEPQSKP